MKTKCCACPAPATGLSTAVGGPACPDHYGAGDVFEPAGGVAPAGSAALAAQVAELYGDASVPAGQCFCCGAPCPASSASWIPSWCKGACAGRPSKATLRQATACVARATAGREEPFLSDAQEVLRRAGAGSAWL